MGFELAENLLSFTGWPVRHFDRIVQALVGAMVSVWSQCFDRFDVAAQFVGDDNPGFAKLGNQSFEKPLCSVGIPTCLHKNIQNVAICVDRAPQPMFLATNCDHYFVHVPLDVWSRAISTDAICEMLAKPIDPKPDCFAADNHAPLRQQVLNISRAQSKAMVSPNRVSNDLTRIAEALYVWYLVWCSHNFSVMLLRHENNLAIPAGVTLPPIA